jgi:Na+/H+ antiporter NhaC
MSKLYYKVRDRAWIVIIALAIAFILLVILGYTINSEKTWGPPDTDQQTESR